MARVSWSRAEAVLKRHRTRLLRRAGVVGIDVGVRLRDGRPTKTPCIRIHVARKLPAGELSKRRALPEEIEGVPVDVVGGTAKPQACVPSAWVLRVFRNPIQGGIAIGLSGRSAFGTLGAVARDAAGDLFALTAAHVVARKNPKPVVQPVPGTWSIGAVDRAVLDSRMDAAKVKLGSQRKTKPGVVGTGVPTGEIDPVPLSKLPFPVRVVGACTGPSRGLVTSTSLSIEVAYPDGPVLLKDQLHIVAKTPGQTFSRSGDSGALVLDEKGQNAVGLLFAGEGEGQADYGVATPIRRVLDELSLML